MIQKTWEFEVVFEKEDGAIKLYEDSTHKDAKRRYVESMLHGRREMRSIVGYEDVGKTAVVWSGREGSMVRVRVTMSGPPEKLATIEDEDTNMWSWTSILKKLVQGKGKSVKHVKTDEIECPNYCHGSASGLAGDTYPNSLETRFRFRETLDRETLDRENLDRENLDIIDNAVVETRETLEDVGIREVDETREIGEIGEIGEIHEEKVKRHTDDGTDDGSIGLFSPSIEDRSQYQSESSLYMEYPSLHRESPSLYMDSPVPRESQGSLHRSQGSLHRSHGSLHRESQGSLHRSQGSLTENRDGEIIQNLKSAMKVKEEEFERERSSFKMKEERFNKEKILTEMVIRVMEGEPFEDVLGKLRFDKVWVIDT